MEDRHSMFITTAFLALIITVVFSATHPNDLNILMDFRNGLSNPERLKWPPPSDGADPCGPPTWKHIICNGNRVSKILVKGLNLDGPLPHNLNQLTMLTHLRFQNNLFEGQLPSLKGLNKLQRASFRMNFFNLIPADFFYGLKDLRVLVLDHNNFHASEGWSFPSDLQDSVHLTNLSCTDCNLVGSLPDFFRDLTSLQSLRLSDNHLSGEIDVVTKMDSLSRLWLNKNHFTGTIPDSIGNLSLLKNLNLNGNQFVGLIPNSLVNMNLDRLDLSYNQLMGPIPKFKSAKVGYSSNHFCQNRPGSPCSQEVMALIDFLRGLNYPLSLVSSWWGNNPCADEWLGLQCDSNQKVSEINLPEFNLTGTLSPSIANLESLTKIRLYGNKLSGPVPENWTSLKYLTWLDLHFNNISLPLPKFNRRVKVVLAGNELLLAEGQSLLDYIIPILFALLIVIVTPICSYLWYALECLHLFDLN